MLEAIGAGSSRQIGKTDWADLWLESPQFAAVKEEIQQIKNDALDVPDDLDPSLSKECACPFLSSVATLTLLTLLLRSSLLLLRPQSQRPSGISSRSLLAVHCSRSTGRQITFVLFLFSLSRLSLY